MHPIARFGAVTALLALAASAWAAPSLESARRSWERALPRSGSDTLELRRARSAAFAAIGAMVRGLERRAALDALIELASREPNRALRTFATVDLLRREALLRSAQRVRFAALRARVFPPRPVMPARGPITVRHFIGEEFFRSELAAYRRFGFRVSAGDRVANARRGRLAVRIARGDAQIFSDMADPRVHAVIFSGHSDIGGVVELALRSAPAERGDKLLVLLQCIGAQTLPMVAARYDRAQVLTTRGPSYEDVDQKLLQGLYAGLERGEAWAQIRGRVRAVRGDIRNYLFPDDPALAKDWDMDRDGRRDLAPGRLSDSRFDVRDGRRVVPGQVLLSAVGYANASHRYYAEDTPGAVFGPRQARDRYVGGGVAAVVGEAVTQIRARRAAGREVFEVWLNSRYAGQPKTFVAAAALFEIHLHFIATFGRRVSERDRLRALIFAGDYLLRMTPASGEADRAMKLLTRLKGFPVLTYGEIEPVLQMEKEHTATSRQIEALAKLLAARARR